MCSLIAQVKYSSERLNREKGDILMDGWATRDYKGLQGMSECWTYVQTGNAHLCNIIHSCTTHRNSWNSRG
jgi:hypothetical protein